MPEDFKPPTPEALDYANAITAAIEAVSAAHVALGKTTMFMDPMSALLGVLGSFIAGAPLKARHDVLAKVHTLIDIAVDQAVVQDRGQRVVAGMRQ